MGNVVRWLTMLDIMGSILARAGERARAFGRGLDGLGREGARGGPVRGCVQGRAGVCAGWQAGARVFGWGACGVESSGVESWVDCSCRDGERIVLMRTAVEILQLYQEQRTHRYSKRTSALLRRAQSEAHQLVYIKARATEEVYNIA